jgi:hypothetical protein
MASDREEPVAGGGDPLADAPPFLSWTGIYLIVLGALAGQVVLYTALTALYR